MPMWYDCEVMQEKVRKHPIIYSIQWKWICATRRKTNVCHDIITMVNWNYDIFLIKKNLRCRVKNLDLGQNYEIKILTITSFIFTFYLIIVHHDKSGGSRRPYHSNIRREDDVTTEMNSLFFWNQLKLKACQKGNQFLSSSFAPGWHIP